MCQCCPWMMEECVLVDNGSNMGNILGSSYQCVKTSDYTSYSINIQQAITQSETNLIGVYIPPPISCTIGYDCNYWNDNGIIRIDYILDLPIGKGASLFYSNGTACTSLVDCQKLTDYDFPTCPTCTTTIHHTGQVRPLITGYVLN
jgi:hypothetical protein